eukprot:TRINITY_DN10098_c0_g1_i2.p1 TRINITY_DN10098_c0_g1~~TRINITY_DN10098_c0_g1_i2.p1  ORF type:complete len:122 (-),score=4.65 TRINITY_DN10098_c0_g1_i2:9-374(-)
MNANFGPVMSQMTALESKVKVEMKDLRSDVRIQFEDLEERVKADTQSWFKMNEQIMKLSRIASAVAFVFAVISSIVLVVKVACALESSEITSSIVAGAMSGDVYAKKVRRAARKKRMEPSS